MALCNRKRSTTKVYTTTKKVHQMLSDGAAVRGPPRNRPEIDRKQAGPQNGSPSLRRIAKQAQNRSDFRAESRLSAQIALGNDKSGIESWK